MSRMSSLREGFAWIVGKLGTSVLAGMLFGLLMLTACERRPLEVLVDEGVKVQLILNWEVNFVELYESYPTGMTVMVWGSQGGVPQVTSTNGNRVTLRLKPDTYKLIIYNETAQEFEYQSFFDYNSYDDIAMRADHYTTKSWDDGVDYMYYPDEVGVTIDQFVITPDMIESDSTVIISYDDFKKNGGGRYMESTVTHTIYEVAWPMTVNLSIKAKVKRRQNISSVEGSISGMADGFYLSKINRTSESGILRLVDDTKHQWKMESYGAEIDSTGYITFTIPSFGMPYGKELLSQRNASDNVLSFYITLTDGSVVQCSYDVGKEIRYVTPEGREAEVRYRQDLQNLGLEVDLSEVIELPSLQTKSGFDARVDEWQEETIDLGGF